MDIKIEVPSQEIRIDGWQIREAFSEVLPNMISEVLPNMIEDALNEVDWEQRVEDTLGSISLGQYINEDNLELNVLTESEVKWIARDVIHDQVMKVIKSLGWVENDTETDSYSQKSWSNRDDD